MAYYIQDIRSFDPQSYPLYFLDANAWIAYIKSSHNYPTESHEKPYIDFLDAIISLYRHKNDAKAAKKIKNFPKLIITSLLLSEIINTYMRNVAMAAYYKSLKQNSNDFSFKANYRPTSDYSKQLRQLITDFESFEDYIDFVNDEFIELGPISILNNMTRTSDFNDIYYYFHMQKMDIPIVTHDRDFLFQDIKIITANKELLSA